MSIWRWKLVILSISYSKSIKNCTLVACQRLKKKTTHNTKLPKKKSGWCSTPTYLLICSSFSRENGHPLLICSSLSTNQIWKSLQRGKNPKKNEKGKAFKFPRWWDFCFFLSEPWSHLPHLGDQRPETPATNGVFLTWGTHPPTKWAQRQPAIGWNNYILWGL